MSNVLVTGGAGFIGAHVTDALAARGHRITVLDDLSGGVAENVTPEADFVHGSINDVFLVNELFSRTHFDYVFHLAAYAAEGLSQPHRQRDAHQRRHQQQREVLRVHLLDRRLRGQP
jgi:UDP-glucose 4-epimerase